MKRVFCVCLTFVALSAFAESMKPLAFLFGSKNPAEVESGLVRCAAVLSVAAAASQEDEKGDPEINRQASNFTSQRANYYVNKIFENRKITTDEGAARVKGEIVGLIKKSAITYREMNATASGKKQSLTDSKFCMTWASVAFTSIPAANNNADPYDYYVQVGSFRDAQDAEKFRSDLLKRGVETRVSEREQNGRPVFRVRAGPFESNDDGERAKNEFDKAGFDTALVRIQRQ